MTLTFTPELGEAYANIADALEAYGDMDFTFDDAHVPSDLADILMETGIVVADKNTIVDLADAAPRRTRQHPDHATVSVLATTNPKRGGSAKRFAAYTDSATVADYIAACVDLGYPRAKALADLKWDEAHGYIAVTS